MFCQGLDLYYCFLVEDGVFVKENCIEKILILDGIYFLFMIYKLLVINCYMKWYINFIFY